MKKLTFLLVVALTTVFIGCDSGADSTNNNNNNNTTSAAPVETPADQSVTPPAPETTISTEGAAPTTPAPTGDVKLNPPHGEPGHRCDIAVGAPLPM